MLIQFFCSQLLLQIFMVAATNGNRQCSLIVLFRRRILAHAVIGYFIFIEVICDVAIFIARWLLLFVMCLIDRICWFLRFFFRLLCRRRFFGNGCFFCCFSFRLRFFAILLRNFFLLFLS